MAKVKASNIGGNKAAGLTEKESKYWNSIKVRNGVVYITAAPGVAKSAITRSIAKKLNLNYIDLRLSQIDETDVGVYPCLRDVDGFKVVSFAVPEWALEANGQPTLIHFEELNRAPIAVRNAALQILLERGIGPKFKFNDNVYMVSSGNLGEEDGTEVEEFDMALNNRLIHFAHELTIKEWVEGFAGENVIPLIVNHVDSNPDEFYKRAENCRAYATPRSWTFLSDYIKANAKNVNDINEVMGLVKLSGHGYIGNSVTKFVRYLENLATITVNDIVNRYDEVAEVMKKFNRDFKNEMLTQLKTIHPKEWNDAQIANVIKFVESLSADERMSYILHIVDEYFNQAVDDKSNENPAKIARHFRDLLVKLEKSGSTPSKDKDKDAKKD